MRIIDKPMIDRTRKYFKANKEKEVTEASIVKMCKLDSVDVRHIISELRFEMPICNTRIRTYLYTTKNKKELQKMYDKTNAICIDKRKKNQVIKRYL